MTTLPCQVEGDLDLRPGTARLRVRGAGSFLDVHLPAPWHWRRLWRASQGLRPSPVVRLLPERAGLRLRLRYGLLRKTLS